MNITENLLTLNPYSRPGTKLQTVKGIVVHWVANPLTTALANRNFFENRKFGKMGYGSAHYIINLDGIIIKCIPENEVAYHVGAKKYMPGIIKKLGGYPNNHTIGIECTHIDWYGKMTDETYNSLTLLVKDLLISYSLNVETNLFLHHDITGKDCHRWFVNNPEEWKKFKGLVK